MCACLSQPNVWYRGWQYPARVNTDLQLIVVGGDGWQSLLKLFQTFLVLLLRLINLRLQRNLLLHTGQKDKRRCEKNSKKDRQIFVVFISLCFRFFCFCYAERLVWFDWFICEGRIVWLANCIAIRSRGLLSWLIHLVSFYAVSYRPIVKSKWFCSIGIFALLVAQSLSKK